MRRALYVGIALSTLTMFMGIVSPVAAKTESLARYFPSTGQYPKGYDVLPIRTYTQPSDVFDGPNADLAARFHFTAGATQVGIGTGPVVTITIARFRSGPSASHFRASFHSDVVKDGKQTSGVLHDLGATEARYDAGECASCGVGSTLSQLVFDRGPIVAVLGVRPADLGTAKRLAAVIDSKLRHAHVR